MHIRLQGSPLAKSRTRNNDRDKATCVLYFFYVKVILYEIKALFGSLLTIPKPKS